MLSGWLNAQFWLAASADDPICAYEALEVCHDVRLPAPPPFMLISSACGVLAWAAERACGAASLPGKFLPAKKGAPCCELCLPAQPTLCVAISRSPADLLHGCAHARAWRSAAAVEVGAAAA